MKRAGQELRESPILNGRLTCSVNSVLSHRASPWEMVEQRNTTNPAFLPIHVTKQKQGKQL